MGWNYRAFAVGEVSTVKAFIAAGEYLQEAILELANYRIELDEHTRRLAMNESNRKQLIDYQSYLDTERADLPATPEGRKRAVRLLFEIPEVQRRIQELGTEIDNAYEVRLKLHMSLTIEAASRAAELQRRLVPVFLAVRNELEITAPDDEYRRAIDKAARKSEDNLNNFVEELRRRAAGNQEGREDPELTEGQ